MGGLARRVSYRRAFKEKFSDIPLLMVDSGFFLADDSSPHGAPRVDAAARNEPTLKAYDRFPVDVANLSSHDLRFISQLMLRADFARNASAYPILKRLVSANIQTTAADATAPQAYVVRDFPARGLRSGRLRVALVGITEPDPSPPEGFKFTDAAEAAKRAVAEARRVSDFVIVLARVPKSEAARIAREVPDVDAVIAGNGDMFTAPVTSGKTLIAFTPFETRMLGELRVYRNGKAGFSSRLRYISLDGAIPDDPAALQVAIATSAAGRDASANAKRSLYDWLSSTRALSFGVRDSGNTSEASPYVSAAACAQCHAAQYVKWANTAHSHATDALVRREYENDASCLKCHASGTTAAAKDTNGEHRSLQNVQCEQCHGPGRVHAQRPDKSYGSTGETVKLCVGCHTSQTTPQFDLQTYWTQIKH